MRNLCDVAYMSCEVALLPFQANANYETWSIDFDIYLKVWTKAIIKKSKYSFYDHDKKCGIQSFMKLIFYHLKMQMLNSLSLIIDTHC